MRIDLKNINILVTGAARGIGAEVAKQLGQSGARLAVHYNQNRAQAERIAIEIGNQSFAVQADLGNKEESLLLFTEVIRQVGQLHVLVNNAGVALKSPISENNPNWIQDFQQTMQVNLISAAILSKMAINHYTKLGGGIIINIGSRAAYRGETRDYLAYAASKGALMSLTKSIAKEFGKEGITAFYLAPGFTRTDMAEQFFRQYGEEPVLQDIALNNITEPHNIAPIVTFLASGMASHATGTSIDINAGSYMH